MDSPRKNDWLENLAVTVAAIIALLVMIAVILTLLGGCTSTHALTPQQIATTRPAAHPFTNIETFIAHGQQTLEFFDVVGFITALAGLGITVWGLLQAEKPIERIGLFIAAIGGAIAAGATAGIIVLPFSPWIVLVVAVGGAGYGSYALYEKYIAKKTVAIPPAK
jgi:hypothetical protein